MDANVILRFLDGRPEGQARAAEALFERAQLGELRVQVHPAILAEVVYVAASPHGLGLARTDITRVLSQFLTMTGIEIDDLPGVLQALQIYAGTTVDWVDALLIAALAQRRVFSFDRHLLAAGAAAPE